MTQPRIDDVVGYLRSHGWAITSSWRSATVWSWGEFDVLVPPNEAVADVNPRLRELVRCVADAEGRSPRGVIREMTVPAADVVSYRAQELTGYVALSAGVRAVRAARDLVVACAREVRQEHETVTALLEGSLLSLSDEVFGLDIALPVEKGSAEPLGRRTALRILHSSMTVLAAASSGDDDAYEQVLREGVSDQVCVALSELAGQDRAASFELTFRWSRQAPLEHAAVRFPRGAGERIRIGTARARRPAESATAAVGSAGVVQGPVIRLADDEAGERWRISVRGVLEVDGAASGRQRLVAVSLHDSLDYEAALAAHREGRVVRVKGAIASGHGASGITASAHGLVVIDPT